MDTNQLPGQFLRRLEQLIPDTTQYKSVCDSFGGKKMISVRINTLKSNGEMISKFLRDSHIPFTTVPWYKDALLLDDAAAKSITELPIYKEGLLYIQSLSSMVPVLALNPGKEDTVLDMAAAPGSKTTQMAAHMNNGGTIIANDVNRGRIFKLKAVLSLQGAQNVQITQYPAQNIWKIYPEYFDKILLDAPCSMEGRIDLESPETFTGWSVKKIRRLSKIQKWMVRSAVSALKPGGTLVYSTCTLAPEENEQVINWILEKEAGNIELEEIKIPDIEIKSGLTRWDTREFSQELKKTKRILPSKVMEGFYLAKIKKTQSNVTK